MINVIALVAVSMTAEVEIFGNRLAPTFLVVLGYPLQY